MKPILQSQHDRLIQQIHARFISAAAGVNKATHYSVPHLYRYVSRGLPRVARYVTPGRQKIYAEKQEYQLVCEAQTAAVGIYSGPSRIAARNDSSGSVHPSFRAADRKTGDTGALKRRALQACIVHSQLHAKNAAQRYRNAHRGATCPAPYKQ